MQQLNNETMKDALFYILQSIVSEPEKVDITESEENGIVSLTVKVGQSDIGKVIGKGGKVIRAMRNAMRIKAIKQNKRINIELAEAS